MVSDRSTRSYWRYLIAAVGLTIFVLIVSASLQYLYRETEENRSYYTHQPAVQPTGATRRVAGEPKSDDYDPHCQQPISREDSDLCAQWSAIESADKGNSLAILNIWITVFAVLISTIGTGLLIVTLWETRKISRAQLRAYIDFSDVKIKVDRTSIHHANICMQYKIKNFGETPAFRVVVDCKTQRPILSDVIHIDDRTPWEPIGGISRNDYHEMTTTARLYPADERQIAQGDVPIWFEISATYRDTFGRRFSTSAIIEPNQTLDEAYVRDGSHTMT